MPSEAGHAGCVSRPDQGRRTFWAKVVADFERSGQSQAAFCERCDLDLGQFRYRLYRFRRAAREAVGSGHFVPMVATAATNTVPFRVRAGNVEVDFAELPPAGYVAELLRLMDR